MAPKFDPNATIVLYLRARGGEAAASNSLAPKVGPLGLSPKKIGDDIAKATKDWKGIRVTVKLSIKNRQATVTVVPTASAQIIKALKEPVRDKIADKGRGHTGNIKWEDVAAIVKVMRYRSLARSPAGVAKEILGTCDSMKCTIDGKTPAEMIEMVNNGELDDRMPTEDECDKAPVEEEEA